MKMIKAWIFSKLLNKICNHIEFFEPYEKNLMETRKKWNDSQLWKWVHVNWLILHSNLVLMFQMLISLTIR
jgi:hypothetical protein